MSVKKKSCIIFVTLLIVMLILPLVSVRLVSSDAGMALLIILFLIPNLPIILYNVPGRTGVNMLPDTVMRIHKAYPDKIMGIKELWWTPLLSAVVFPAFCAIVFEEMVVELLVYSGLYLGVGAVAMLGSHFGKRMQQKRK